MTRVLFCLFVSSTVAIPEPLLREADYAQYDTDQYKDLETYSLSDSEPKKVLLPLRYDISSDSTPTLLRFGRRDFEDSNPTLLRFGKRDFEDANPTLLRFGKRDFEDQEPLITMGKRSLSGNPRYARADKLGDAQNLLRFGRSHQQGGNLGNFLMQYTKSNQVKRQKPGVDVDGLLRFGK